MECADTCGKEGCYSGAVDQDLVPHGRGTMEYGDGTWAVGTWERGRLSVGGGRMGMEPAKAPSLGRYVDGGPPIEGPGLETDPNKPNRYGQGSGGPRHSSSSSTRRIQSSKPQPKQQRDSQGLLGNVTEKTFQAEV